MRSTIVETCSSVPVAKMLGLWTNVVASFLIDYFLALGTLGLLRRRPFGVSNRFSSLMRAFAPTLDSLPRVMSVTACALGLPLGLSSASPSQIDSSTIDFYFI